MGRTVLITGANRGIGYELAKQISQSATVIGTARNASAAGELRALKNVHVVGMDISSEESVRGAVDEINKLAPEGVDELWNNAAINGVRGARVTQPIPTAGWLAEFQTNVIGQTTVTRYLLPLLQKGKGKKVVFISSGAGSIGETDGSNDMVVYHSSKAALNMTIKYWHHTLSKEGFVVTPMDPGWVITDMGGPNAKIQPEDSVRGMIKVVGELTQSSEIKLRTYNGGEHTW